MELYNIRIILLGRNEYKGSIIKDEKGQLYGISTENNYDQKDILSGEIREDGIYLEIHCEREVIPIFAKENSFFPKQSIVQSSYFCGNTLDTIKDVIYIEMTNVKEIEKKLVNGKLKKLFLKQDEFKE